MIVFLKNMIQLKYIDENDHFEVEKFEHSQQNNNIWSKNHLNNILSTTQNSIEKKNIERKIQYKTISSTRIANDGLKNNTAIESNNCIHLLKESSEQATQQRSCNFTKTNDPKIDFQNNKRKNIADKRNFHLFDSSEQLQTNIIHSKKQQLCPNIQKKNINQIQCINLSNEINLLKRKNLDKIQLNKNINDLKIDEMNILLGDQYHQFEHVCIGAFGHIFSAICKKSDELIVLKVIKWKYESIPPEIRVLINLKHQNIITIGRVYNYKFFYFIEMEYYHYDLSQFVQKFDVMKYLFKQLIDALIYLHSNDIIHCDVKPTNILVTADYQVKLIDLGMCYDLSTQSSEGLTKNHFGTFLFNAPELYPEKSIFTPAIDIFSVGMTLIFMLTNTENISYNFSNIQKYLNIIKNEQAFEDLLIKKIHSKEMAEILVSCCRNNPIKRISLTRLKQRIENFNFQIFKKKKPKALINPSIFTN